jgi:hypothetical protein
VIDEDLGLLPLESTQSGGSGHGVKGRAMLLIALAGSLELYRSPGL